MYDEIIDKGNRILGYKNGIEFDLNEVKRKKLYGDIKACTPLF